MNPEQAAALRAPFAPGQIGKLPKGGTTLDFVGHASVTDRLLQVDPEWSWEPLAYDTDGGPLIRYGTKEASLWGRLTVCGVTRIGVGTANVGAFDLDKQLISDLIRNIGMRFGIALDLWSREPLHDAVPPFDPAVDADASVIEVLKVRIAGLDDTTRLTFTRWKNSQGYGWPWTVAACVQMHTELDRLESEDAAPTGSVPATPPVSADGLGVVAGAGPDGDAVHSSADPSGSPALNLEDPF